MTDMHVLTAAEIDQVSGAGIIKDQLAALGNKVGGALYGKLSNTFAVNLPLIGEVSLKSVLPDLGAGFGAAIGSLIGSNIENTLKNIPFLNNIFASVLK
jgi:hypothetical protein